MGIILSKFRKKKTSEEVLESIEETICSIEESQKESQLQQRKIRRISYASVTLLVFAALSYLYFFSKNLRRLEAFFIVIPTLIIAEILRRAISWYYQRKVVKNQKKLIDLRAQKKKILDEVMNNETFNKAKEILEKYAPDQLPKGPGIRPVIRSTPLNTSVAKTPAINNNNVKKSLFLSDKPSVPSPAINNSQTLVKSYPFQNLPRPILPADKTVLEKLVEMIVGDGPSQRFALICRACNSHNGMALKEEFEYLAYRCAYCSEFNPARKQRLVAPKLPDYPSSMNEDFAFNSSMHGLRGVPSKALAISPAPLNNIVSGHVDGKLAGDLDKKIDEEVDGEISGKVDDKVNNKSNDEIDGEISGPKDEMVMEVDEEKDMAEYVSDEDSISESDSLMNAETAKIH